MCREDELQRQRRRPAVTEPLAHSPKRFTRHALLELVLAATPHTVVLLGDVDELEVDRERSDHRGLLVEREPAHGTTQLVARRAFASLPRQQADLLLGGEQLLAALLDQQTTEHVAEEPNVTPEPRVRAHRPILTARNGRAPPTRAASSLEGLAGFERRIADDDWCGACGPVCETEVAR